MPKTHFVEHLGGSVGCMSDLGSGHDLAVCEFKPCVGFHADSSELGERLLQILCLPLSLCPSPAHALFLSVSQK